MHASSRWKRIRRLFAVEVHYEWRGAFVDEEPNALHAEAFEHPVLDDGWLGQVRGEDRLRPFYFDARGFEPTNAGLIRLA